MKESCKRLPTSHAPEPAVRSGYFPVLAAALRALPELPCDLFIQPDERGRKLLYRSAASGVSLPRDAVSTDGRVRHLFLREEDRAKFEAALAQAPAPDDADAFLALTIERRRAEFETIVLSGSADEVVDQAEAFAEDLLRVVTRDDFATAEATALLKHDCETFQHSCNVAIYVGALAKRLGLASTEMGAYIAGGLVHDIGKRDIPRAVLQKPGLLDEAEREQIRQHPTIGFRFGASGGRLQWPQLMMIYQHHERLDGRGYPVGAVSGEILLASRMCAVADVFDALTASNRAYREPDSLGGAIETMLSDTGRFDPELLKLWTEVVTR